MFLNEDGANEYTAEEIEALFSEESQQETPPVNEEPTDAQSDDNQAESKDDDTKEKSKEDKVDTTKAFAHRLKESTEKARREEREAIAKQLGFDSYEALQKDKENQILKDKGFDPEVAGSTIDELVKNRIDNDPRMAELEELRRNKVMEFGKKELAEISKLTDGQINKFEQLPQEVIELWKKTGSLKQSYLALEGDKLVTKLKSEKSKGSTDHMNTPANNSTVSDSQKRPLTAKERRMWKTFMPNISDEELDKKRV